MYEVVEYSQFPVMLIFVSNFIFFTSTRRIFFCTAVLYEWKVVRQHSRERNLFAFNIKQLRVLISDGTQKKGRKDFFLNPNGLFLCCAVCCSSSLHLWYLTFCTFNIWSTALMYDCSYIEASVVIHEIEMA